MEKLQKKEHLLLYKLIYTAGIMAAFLVGKSLPLHGVDMSVYAEQVGADISLTEEQKSILNQYANTTAVNARSSTDSAGGFSFGDHKKKKGFKKL